MPTTGTVLALLYILYIRYHVLDVLDVTTTYVVLTIVKSTTPLLLSLAAQKQGGCKGGNGARSGQAQDRKLLQTLGKWRAYPVNIARVVGIVRNICNADTSPPTERGLCHNGL